jgi:hypothetical protein
MHAARPTKNELQEMTLRVATSLYLVAPAHEVRDFILKSMFRIHEA